MARGGNLVFRAGLCLLVAFSAALEDHDDPRPPDLPSDEDILYHEYNYVDSDPPLSQPDGDPSEDLLLLQLLASLQNRDEAQLKLRERSKLGNFFDSFENQQENSRKNPVDLQMKNLVLKRPSNDAGSKIHPAVGPQPKWKTKKGRVGSQLVCYFKLCAFRPPWYSKI